VITETLKFRLADGTQRTAEAELGETQLPAGEFLVAQPVSLDGGDRKLRQHRPVDGRYREAGYERLDNEILVGRRLAVAAGRGYPVEVACLYGDDADGADPYALFEAYEGNPLREACKVIREAELKVFPVSLLRGLCWLAAVGVAHRGIGPDNVLWDARRGRALITDFSVCTVFGTMRTPVPGFPAWVPKEQRSGAANGRVGQRDDIWAAAQLIFYAHTHGQEYVSRDQLVASGLGGQLVQALAWAFSPLTADRPTASELLAFLGSPDPSPQGFTAGPSLIKGRASFLAARNLKHHKDPVQVLVPPDLDEDLEWAQQSSGPARPPAAPAAVESFAGAPPVFADSPVDDPRTAQDQVGAPAPGEQPGDRGKKAGFFGRRRESR
jgi:serine/threonine protein kinase